MEQRSSDPGKQRRASRRKRVPQRGARLRDRDIDILLALAKMRLLRTSDLGRLFFDSIGTCQKRMRKLYDAGLVRAIVTELAAENRYALSRLGYALLEEAIDEDELPAWRPAPRTDGRSIAHLDLLNRFRIALACEAPRFEGKLVRFVPEWDLRAGQPRAQIIPDAIAIVSTSAGHLTLAVEVDTGSEAPAAVAKKVRAYEQAELMRQAVFGAVAPNIVILTPSPRRARSVAKSIAQVGGGRRVWIGAAPFVVENGGLVSGLARVGGLASKTVTPSEADFGLGLLAAAARTGVGAVQPATSVNRGRVQQRAVLRHFTGSSRAAVARSRSAVR